MMTLTPPWPLFSTFLIASVVLAITPGPGVLYIVTRSLVQGRRAGLISVAAVALGNFGNVIAASYGLAVLFSISSTALIFVKYAGACYLVYLGIQMLRKSAVITPASAPASLGRHFREGVIVALLNPKTTLFFAAFLPQFLNPAVPPAFQSITLGALFVIIALVTDSIYALAASSFTPVLTRTRGAQQMGHRLGGSIFIALGIFTALTGEYRAK